MSTKPGQVHIEPGDVEALAAVVAHRLGSVHLATADGGILSQLIQGNAATRSLQREWKLYPTLRHIAWRMVTTLPFETIPVEELRVWDGTCGSGTILVAALDRLRSLVPDLPPPELRAYLTRTISGNDKALAMGDATRIALDLALGAPVGTGWRITAHDIRNVEEPPNPLPSVIVSNPPFQGLGRTTNLAEIIVKRYVETLLPGGLFSVIVPASMCSTESAREVRRTLVEQFRWYEVTELPPRAFATTDQEAVVLTGSKRTDAGADETVVTWRRTALGGRTTHIEALKQREWLSDSQIRLISPLALRLSKQFARFPRLASYIPPRNASQGVSPGSEGSDDVLTAPETNAVPYLRGRTYMMPFAMAWGRHPSWLRYESPHLQWPRRSSEWIFRSQKVIVSRFSTWGNPWRVLAVIDERGVFPSDMFYALVPRDGVALDTIAGMFNSSLINCWLDLTNHTTAITWREIQEIPVPGDDAADRIARLSQAIREARTSQLVSSREALARLTLELDTAVLDAYSIPKDLREQIAEYLLSFDVSRPGFDRPLVTTPVSTSEQLGFATERADRLQELFNVRQERSLSSREAAELDELVTEWQRSVTTSATRLLASRSTNLSTGMV